MFNTCMQCRGRGYNNYSTGEDAVCTACGGEGRIFTVNPMKGTRKPVPSKWVRFLRWLRRG